MDLVRRSATALLAACMTLSAVPATAQDGQHDFDFAFGTWHAHLSRLLHPLSGSHRWTQYTGTSIVHKVLNGSANLGELDARGPSGRINGISLRLYDPQSAKWSISWANAKDGALSAPLLGAFKNTQGEFVDKETFNGRPIVARIVFSDVTPRSFRVTQSFSSNEGRTWEANWIADFTRQRCPSLEINDNRRQSSSGHRGQSRHRTSAGR